MTDLPPLTATEYGHLAAAMVSVFIPPRCPACQQPPSACQCSRYCNECECTTNHSGAQHRDAANVCPACGQPRESNLAVDELLGGRADSPLCRACYREQEDRP